MAGQTNAAPVIVKRRKVVAAAGHHGGAWKVAYADFVTAMMAFFLLMWLLNATTEKQRKGIADYFDPQIPVHRVSGGGSGAFGGDSMFSEEIMARSGTGARAAHPTQERRALGARATQDSAAEQRALEALNATFAAIGGESSEMERLLRHVVTRLTDEGLVVELFDLPGSPLFEEATTDPRPVLRDLVGVVARVFARAQNRVAVQGHVKSYPITLIIDPTWDLSAARAQAARRMLQDAGVEGGRMQRISGFADRVPLIPDPMATRNNRLELVLLRWNR